MDLGLIGQELREKGLMTNPEELLSAGDLFKVLFEEKNKTKQNQQIVGDFIVSHMSKEEFVRLIIDESYIEEIYQVVELAGRTAEFIAQVIRYFSNREYWGFFDYQDIIAFGFRFLENWTAKKLEAFELLINIDLDEKEKTLEYLSWIKTALMFSGEKEDYGRAYEGGDMIRKYTPYLHYSILEKILEDAEYRDGISSIDFRYRFQMIQLCKIKSGDAERIRRNMLFRYIYYPYFKQAAMVLFDNLFVSEGYDIYVNADDALHSEYLEILSYRKNQDGYSRLLALHNVEENFMTLHVKNGNNMQWFKICLEEQTKLICESEFMECESDEVWYRVSNEINDWSKITEKRIYKVLYSAFADIESMLLKAFGEGPIVDMDKNLEILYIYTKSLRGVIFEKELPFSDEYSYQLSKGDKVFLHLKSMKGHQLSNNFFAIPFESRKENERQGHIRNINALIGKNGSGKTSIATLLMGSDIFGALFEGESVEAEYCIVYRVGKNIYYSCTNRDADWIEVFCEDAKVHSYQNTENDKYIYKRMFNTTVVLYHNIVNALAVGNLTAPMSPIRSSGREDLTTSHILKNELHSKNFTDVIYVMNLMEDIEAKKESTEYNFFEAFELKKIENVTMKNGREIKKISKKNFLKEYIKYLYEGRNSNIKFLLEDVSTGESARLLLFARLHSVFHMNAEYLRVIDSEKETIIQGDKKRGNYLLILDEIEAFFHPTWQRRIVHDLIAFLEWEEKQFEAYDNVHVILSSNSPFYLSDLPKTKFIRLDENNDRGKRNQTFGENIHTILRESFLVENGLMGEFALKKIEKAMCILKAEKPTSEEWDYVNEIMELVEEPIMKSALSELYQAAVERTGNKEQKMKEYRRQIAEMERKLQKLQGEK